MNICPKCNKKIEYLNFSAKVIHIGTFDGYDWDTKEDGDWSDEEYYCPECDELIIKGDEEARAFLNKEDEN